MSTSGISRAELDSAERTTVAAVDRALSLLLAFHESDDQVTLAQLASRTGLYKSTILRLLQTLEANAFIIRTPAGTYRLGPMNFRLGRLYQQSFKLEHVVMPVLQDLAEKTKESASFFVLDGQTRTCLFRIDSNQAIRHTVQVGEPLPAGRGATGRVLSEFKAGATGTAAEKFRSLPLALAGKNALDISVITGPVFGIGGALKGAVTVSGPASRFNAKAQARATPLLIPALATITKQLGGDASVYDG